MCMSINYILDNLDYERKYLNIKKLKKLILRDKPVTKQTKHDSYNIASVVTTTPDTKKSIDRVKGTLLQYFPIVNKNNFFRV